jgi:hypothetical protein
MVPEISKRRTGHSIHGTMQNATLHQIHEIPIPGVDSSNKITTEIQGGPESPRKSRVLSKAKAYAGRLSMCSTSSTVEHGHTSQQSTHAKDIEMGSTDRDGITVSYTVSRTEEEV